MKLGDSARNGANIIRNGFLGLAVAVTPHMAFAQAAADGGAQGAAAVAAPATAEIVRMAPTVGKGMPIDGAYGFQDQYSPNGDYAVWMHDAILMPLITVICLFVLGLMLWIAVRYNRRTNKVPSRTSHNTLIEVVWTLLPVLILVGVAVPSIDLLAKQYKSPPADALTVKITGNQWYWSYGFPDNGDAEFDSYMLNEANAPVINPGKRIVGSDPSDGPAQLEVDNRLVLPVGETIRMQVTASDVIHSYSIPSLWFKIDAVPGRLNERTLFIKEPGVYYGQCSELCGVKHGYMPIAIEALPRPQFDAWLLSKGGTLGKPAKAEPDAGLEAGSADVEEAPASVADDAVEIPVAPAPAA